MVGIDTVFLNNIDDFDSLIITTTTLVPSDTIFIKHFTSEQQVVGFDSLLFSNRYGCDSLVITEYIFQEENVATHFIIETSCDQNEIGVDTIFLETDDEADSLVIITTTFLPSDTIYVNEITFDSTIIGKDSLLLSKQNGCDSLIIIETIYQAPAIDVTQLEGSTCDHSFVGTDTLILKNRLGFDSLIITRIALLPSDTIYLSQQSCIENNVGIKEQLLMNQYGCDSLLIIETIQREGTSSIIEMTTCDVNQVGKDTLYLSTITFGKPPFYYTILKERDTIVSGELERLEEQLTLLNLNAGNYSIELTNDLGVTAQQEIQIKAYSSIERSIMFW